MNHQTSKAWRIRQKETILKTIPFNVESLTIQRNGQDLSHPYFRIDCRDWVNVLPITKNGKAILIRQMRAGSGREVLEVPGGMVDAHEQRDPTMAAVRELEEETGFMTSRILPLLSINPNPAIQTNRIHLFVALDCTPNPDRRHFPDEGEDISLCLHDARELDFLVRTGQIDHGLSALCILLASKYVTITGEGT